MLKKNDTTEARSERYLNAFLKDIDLMLNYVRTRGIQIEPDLALEVNKLFVKVAREHSIVDEYSLGKLPPEQRQRLLDLISDLLPTRDKKPKPVDPGKAGAKQDPEIQPVLRPEVVSSVEDILKAEETRMQEADKEQEGSSLKNTT